MGESGATHHGSADGHDDFAAVLPDDPQRIEASAGIECINCAVCYAACDTSSAGTTDYLGPAALNRAWTLVNDERDGDRRRYCDAASSRRRLPFLPQPSELHDYCPNGIEPGGLHRRAEAGLSLVASSRWGA